MRATISASLYFSAAFTAAAALVRRAAHQRRRLSVTATHGRRDLWACSAREIIRALRDGEVDPIELIDVLEERICTLDVTDGVNAVPPELRFFENARERARRLQPMIDAYRRDVDSAPQHFLWGLPVAIKDSMEVAGELCTMGSLLCQDLRAETSHASVMQLCANGAIPYAKTNTPEFCAGSQTFNPLFGVTATPHDLSCTAGGSSGGSAAALASGMAWIATGSDLGGSLRIPAAFCGVVGIRPTPGFVAADSAISASWRSSVHSVTGPMARDVRDLALLYDAMTPRRAWVDAHADDRGRQEDIARWRSFTHAARAPVPNRLSCVYSSDLFGCCAHMVDEEVSARCAEAAQILARCLGTNLLSDSEKSYAGPCPDLLSALWLFRVLRAEGMKADWPEGEAFVIRQMKAGNIKPELAWNILQGYQTSSQEITAAHAAQRQLSEQVDELFGSVDVLVCPATCVPPFDKKIRYVQKVSGLTQDFESYVEWLRPTYAVTLMNCPAISVPIGHTKSGLPIGLQIVTAPRRDALLINVAAALERALKSQDPKVGSRVIISPHRSSTGSLASQLLRGPTSASEALQHHQEHFPWLGRAS